MGRTHTPTPTETEALGRVGLGSYLGRSKSQVSSLSVTRKPCDVVLDKTRGHLDRKATDRLIEDKQVLISKALNSKGETFFFNTGAPNHEVGVACVLPSWF